MNNIIVVLLVVGVARLLTCETQIHLLQNFTGNFGISGRSSVDERGYRVWIIAGNNIHNLSQENFSTINTVYVITLNFSSVLNTLACGEQYVNVYRQSTGVVNTSTLLTATFTGTDLQYRSVVIKSSIVTVVYRYVGQHENTFSGFDATYSIKPLHNYNTTALAMNSFSERKCTGHYHHVTVYDETTEMMLLHGGRDHQGILCNGIVKINTFSMNKEYVYWLEEPSGRYLHSGIFTHENLIIYGGRNANETFGELWRFNTNDEQWSKLTGNVSIYGHSATLVEDYMIIIGGINSIAVNSFVLQYNIVNDTWQSLETSGAPKPASIVGHTVVYDSHSNSLLIYGGALLIDFKFVESSSLYSLDMHSMQWSMLHVTSSNFINLIRIFSASVLIEQTLYVFGGLVANSNGCYSNNTLIFVLNSTCGHIPVLGIEETYPRFGTSAIAMRNGTVLLSGGYHSWTYDDVVTFVPPQDLCTLLTTQNDCSAVQWCQYCHFDTSDNSSCISSFRNDMSNLCNEATVFLSPHCSLTTPCASSKTCGSCLSNDFQQHRSCHWCPCSEKCVNSSIVCLEDPCFLQHSTSSCYFSQCAAAICDDCTRKGCVWTHQLEYVHGIIVRVFHQPNQWQCFTSEVVNSVTRQLSTSSFTAINRLQDCPLPCSSFMSCSTCTNALGNLVGPIGCTWIHEIKKCMSHLEVRTNCPVGSCGIEITDEHACHEPCNSFNYCHSCLQTAYCIWCYQNGSNGEGFCVNPEGTVECLNSDAIPISQDCPAEDECINGHNSCFHDQQCTDLLDGFMCTCPNDYTAGEVACVPICIGNCSNQGVCISPYTCRCDLGYTGENCSVQCECNGHSDCVDDSVTGRAICIKCLHNTQGESCNACKPSFVGSGKDGCISCLKFCHGNSETCVDVSLMSNNSMDLTNITTSSDGPRLNESICIQCQNNTTGRFCNECVSGYFYQKTSESFQCIQCSCNSHSRICNNTTGLDCDCQNNTRTVCPSDTSCMGYQCASCVEGYVGVPRNGRQCYKKLKHSIHHFDNLPARKTSYYLVQPQYSDLDVQVFINIIEGNLDVFVSNSSQTFEITVNFTTWEHNVEESSNLSEPHSTVMSYFNINERFKLEFSYQHHNLRDEKFYFVLQSKKSSTDFNIIFYQAALKLNWFSMIVIFLCFFVIMFLSIMMTVYMKRQWNIYRHQRTYKYITNKWLSRPFSKMHVFVDHSMFVQQTMNVTRIFCRPTSSVMSKQTISLIPLSVQPTADSNAYINTVLIQLPKSSSGHTNLTSGTCLNCNNLSNNRSRMETKVVPI